MKELLEVKASESHSIYRNTSWVFSPSEVNEDKLIQTIPILFHGGGLIPTFLAGQHLKIAGVLYHVTDSERIIHEDRKEMVFVYTIKKGKYNTPEWLTIGEVN